MKNVMKAMIISGVIPFLLGAVAGCKDKSREYQGIYFNVDDHSQYIELEDDGVMFIRQRINRIGEWPPEYKETTGKWKIYGGEVVFIDPSGYEQRYEITRNTIRTAHTAWVRHGASLDADRTADNIPGNYILEETVGQETKRQDGIIVFGKDGTIRGAELAKWKVENGFVQLYAVEGPQVGINGRLEGDDIVFEIITKDGEGAIARFIKQDGKARPRQEEPQITSQRKETGGIDSIPDDKMTWVKCNNPQCKAEYEMSEKQYYKDIQARLNPAAMMSTPALICEKCGKPSVYKAEKCGNPNCGVVFLANSVPNDFADRCPKCGRSENEEIRKARKAAGQ